MKPLISPYITILLLGSIQYTESACSTFVSTVEYSSSFIIDDLSLIVLECNPDFIFSNGNVIHLVTCVGDEWDPVVVTCEPLNGDVKPECINLPNVPDNAQSTAIDGIFHINFLVYRCSSDYSWLSGAITTVSQCKDGEWTEVTDVCYADCCYPKHCGDIFDLGLTASGLYNISPTGESSLTFTQARCDLSTDTDNLGGSWTNIFSLCGTTDTLEGGSSYISGYGDDTLTQSYFIGLQYLSELTASLGEQKIILAISFLKEGNIVYHATYSDFSVGVAPTYVLTSIGNYHGNAGDGLCHHVNAPFDFGDGTNNARWWGSLDDLENIIEMKGSFLTNLIWGPLVSLTEKPFDCVQMRIRTATFESDKLCPPEIGSEPWWTTTTVSMTYDRYPGAQIPFDCHSDLAQATDATGVMISHGTITCSQTAPYQWAPSVTLPCAVSCPGGYEMTADSLNCYNFSNETASRVAAIYGCMQEGASLADFTIAESVSMAVDPDYRWIAETSRRLSMNDNTLTPDNDPLAYGFYCPSENNCVATSPNQCTFISSNNIYGYFDCDEEMKYICQIPGTCPIGFFLSNGGCYKIFEGHFDTTEALKECNTLGAALAWFTTLEEVQSVAIDIAVDYAVTIHELSSVKFLIGNNKGDGAWTYFNVYPDMTASLKELLNMDDPDPYRILVVTSDEGTFEFASESDPSTTVNALCQYHGPIGCRTSPPSATANMVIDYDDSRSIFASATYRCDSGYFFDGNVTIEKKTVTCIGQLGEWGEPLTETCQQTEVCDSSTLPATTNMEVQLNGDSLYLGGSIIYTCPPNMTKIDDQTDTVVTCIELSPSIYAFDSTVITECDVCTGSVTVENASVAYEGTNTYVLNSVILATCHRNHEYSLGETIQQISCETTGWNLVSLLPCYAVCSEQLPALTGDSRMIAPELASNAVGTVLQYSCIDQSYIAITAAGETRLSSVFITCSENFVWISPIPEEDLKCVEVCQEPPPAPDHGTREWNAFSYENGTTITYTCIETYSFPDGTSTMQVTCNGSDWAPTTEAEITCKQSCATTPPIPGRDSHIIAEVPTSSEVGTVLKYTCEEGLHIIPTQVGDEIRNVVLITCNSQLDWESEIPTVDLICAEICPKQPPYAPEHALIEWDNSYVVDAQVSYICSDNYLFPDLLPSKQLTCNGVEWIPNKEEEFNCKQYCTSAPPSPESDSGITAEIPTSPEVSTTLVYSCAEGFHIIPTQANQAIVDHIIVTCNEELQWASPINMGNLACAKMCLDPPPDTLENGQIGWDNSNTEGTQIVYECNENYMFGDRSATWNLTCNDTVWGLYDEALFRCFKVCPDPPESIGNGIHNYAFSVGLLNEEITYTCPQGFANFNGDDSVTIQCLTDGWNVATNFECEKACPGDPPEPPPNANYTFDGDIREGVEVSYFCEGNFIIGVQELDINCTNGEWTITELPTCLNVTIEIPPLFIPPDAEFYDETSTDFQDEIYNLNTISGVLLQRTKSVIPLEDGAIFHSELSECAMKNNYFPENEVCVNNPLMCPDGFSFSIWVNIPVESGSTEKRYLVSTGGDIDGSPGIAIYQQGDYLWCLVSTGIYYWTVSSFHHTPSEEWTVFACTWKQDLGLKMFMMDQENATMQKLAHIIFPQEAVYSQGFDPPKVLLGCHATGTTPTYRHFLSGALDAFVVWRRLINDTKLFLGGYRKDTRKLSEILKLMNKIPKTPENVNSILSEVITAQQIIAVETEVDTISTPAIISPDIYIPNSVNTDDFDTTVAIISNIIQDQSTINNKIDKSAIPGYQKTFTLLSNILTESEENKEKWNKLANDDQNNDVMAISLNVTNFMQSILVEVPIEDGQSIEESLFTDNIFLLTRKDKITELYKRKKIVYPRMDLEMADDWISRVRIAVWVDMVNDIRCINRSLSATVVEFITMPFLHNLRVNELHLNPNDRLEFDSPIMITSIEVDPDRFADGSIDQSQPGCGNKNEENYPIGASFFHMDSSKSHRKLLFFEEKMHTEIIQRYCAWMNPNLGQNGLWDISNCKLVSTSHESTQCACRKDGAYAIIAHKKMIIEIEDDPAWLKQAKYIAYGISAVLIIIYILVVALSGDLKDQFHLIGVNLSIAVLCGSIAMVASDLNSIRIDQELCGTVSSLIYFFYLSVGTWVIALGHSSFKAITAGVINGKLQSYVFMSWGFSLTCLGLIYMFFLHDIGTDPRCFVAWEEHVKLTLLGPQIAFAALAIFIAFIVLCNLSTPALRKENLVDDYGSFCRGASFVLIAFGLTWIFGYLAYMKTAIEGTDFYPIYTMLNASMGIVIFVCIGLGSNRFRIVITGRSNHRRALLAKNAFGKRR